MSDVETGLSWVGRTEAEITFYMLVLVAVIFSLIMIINIFSNLSIVIVKSSTKAAKDTAKEKLKQSLILFLILGLILGFVLFFSYINMRETQKSKAYAAASGAMDILSDIRSNA
jgi:Na+-driven multidrug efflux pump